jgi:16S rRNA (uracil1498-N3)-methyltransferase
MPRLHVDKSRMDTDAVVITHEDHRYIARVLRLGAGDRVTLFDGKGGEAEAELVRVGPRAAELIIRNRTPAPPRVGPDFILIQALGRGEKLDLVVQKATELGVHRIIPVTTERAVPRLETVRSDSRRVRWQKIAREAARQSRRADLPEIDPVTSFTVAIEAAPRDALKLVFWEEAREGGRGRGRGLKEILPLQPPPAVVIAIGPEGGFSEEEVARAKEAGFVVAGLGPRILRTETAALVALSVLNYTLGDLG